LEKLLRTKRRVAADYTVETSLVIRNSTGKARTMGSGADRQTTAVHRRDVLPS